jgi:hypothetical protein
VIWVQTPSENDTLGARSVQKFGVTRKSDFNFRLGTGQFRLMPRLFFVVRQMPRSSLCRGVELFPTCSNDRICPSFKLISSLFCPLTSLRVLQRQSPIVGIRCSSQVNGSLRPKSKRSRAREWMPKADIHKVPTKWIWSPPPSRPTGRPCRTSSHAHFARWTYRVRLPQLGSAILSIERSPELLLTNSFSTRKIHYLSRKETIWFT